MAFFSEFFRSSTAHPWISALRGATDWALYRYSSLLSWQATFRYIDRTCLPGEFKPILGNTGVLKGYQRT